MTNKLLSAGVAELERENEELRQVVTDQLAIIEASKLEQQRITTEIEVYHAKNNEFREAINKYEAIIDTKDAELVALHARLDSQEVEHNKDKKHIEELKTSMALARNISQTLSANVADFKKQLVMEKASYKAQLERLVPAFRAKSREARVSHTALLAGYKLLSRLKDMETFDRLRDRARSTVRDQLVNREVAAIFQEAGVSLDGLIKLEVNVVPQNLDSPTTTTTPAGSPERMLTRSAKKRRLMGTNSNSPMTRLTTSFRSMHRLVRSPSP